MCKSTTQSIVRILSVVALVLGLAGVAWGQGAPPPAGPLQDIQATLGIILDRLDDLETKGGPCEVPPVWGQTYETADRFVSVLGGAAFCDKATGLVWDGSPDSNAQASWQLAITHCTTRTVGGQHGFHLPLIEQLTSLLPLLAMDLNSTTGDGPFTDVQPAAYWSATTSAFNPANAMFVNFDNGFVDAGAKDNVLLHAWCVRGGQGFDGNTHNTLH